MAHLQVGRDADHEHAEVGEHDAGEEDVRQEKKQNKDDHAEEGEHEAGEKDGEPGAQTVVLSGKSVAHLQVGRADGEPEAKPVALKAEKRAHLQVGRDADHDHAEVGEHEARQKDGEPEEKELASVGLVTDHEVRDDREERCLHRQTRM